MYTLLIFLIFLSPLVFFHELGHFLFARLFGVRVEVFSIGFGKKLFSFKKGDTEYRFSLIPLGGFVKMFGDDPLRKNEVAESEQSYAFNHKSKWARFWIVFGGPLANFLMAFAIYGFMIWNGETVSVFKVGEVKSDSKIAEIGFQTGDTLLKINGEDLYTQEDFASMKDSGNIFKVQRGDKEIEISSDISGEDFLREYYVNTQSLEEPSFVNSKGEVLFVYDQNPLPEETTSLQELILRKPSLVYFYDQDKKLVGQLPNSANSIEESLWNHDYYNLGLKVKNVISDSAAEKAGLKNDDIFIASGSTPFYQFTGLRKFIQEQKNNPTEYTIVRDGEEQTILLAAEEKKHGDTTFYSVGIESSVQLHQTPKKYIEGKSLMKSLVMGYKRTELKMFQTLEGFKKIFFSNSSMSQIGGPITIAKVATDSFDKGLFYFFRLMAIMSINLGIINLFPIPVLDGGHILFLIVELFNRGPLSRRKMEMAQQFGLSLLLLLIMFALYNDFSRIFI